MISMSSFGFNGVQNLLTTDWKLDKGLPFETASVHQGIQMPVRFASTIITSLLFHKLPTRLWAFLGVFLVIMSYGLAYCGRFIETENFVHMQYMMGVLNGTGTGIGINLCTITPQAWFEDKKRAQYQGYMTIGAPIASVVACLTWPLLVDQLTWSGAVLILIGVLSQVLYCFENQDFLEILDPDILHVFQKPSR